MTDPKPLNPKPKRFLLFALVSFALGVVRASASAITWGLGCRGLGFIGFGVLEIVYGNLEARK